LETALNAFSGDGENGDEQGFEEMADGG